MTDITIPTIDEITGHTVMTKMRSLIKSYIAFANEIKEMIDNIPTDVYDKEEIDGMLGDIDDAIDAINDTLPNKQDTLTAGANITILDNVISAVGGSGSITRIVNTTLANDNNTITISQNTNGFYILNIPAYGGLYLVNVKDGNTTLAPANSTHNFAYCTFAGGSISNYLIYFGAGKSSNNIVFQIQTKSVTNLNGVYTSSSMNSGTAYEIYFIPTSE